tara:strand:- start:196 stop:651 length:456 start_codon:yes stop_codon:yes gene_type:complete
MNLEVLREQIASDEGRVNSLYLCSLGHKTLGIGHLVTLDDPEWPLPIGTEVSDDRINEAFDSDIDVTIDDCRIIFKDFDDMPEEIQLCLANMAFQLGRPTLSKFKKSVAFANEGNWSALADEILDSRWAKEQTPHRALRISDRIRAVADGS